MGAVVSAAAVPPSVSVAGLLDLGDVVTTGPQQYIGRDLGWSGRVGYTIINGYGDSGYATGTNDVDGRTGYVGPFAANSFSTGTSNGGVVHTPFYTTLSNGHQVANQFCNFQDDEDPQHHGLGITAVQNVNNTFGILYYQLQLRNLDYEPNAPAYFIGSGIGQIDNSFAGYPICHRLGQYVWDGQTEPQYGSTASYSGPDPDTAIEYIYALGGGNFTTEVNGTQYVFLSRVPQTNAYDVDSYEYWNGNSWQSERLYTPGSTEAIKSVDSKGNTYAATDIGQASINWSPYYNAWLLFEATPVYLLYNAMQIRTATRPEGPWGPPVLVADSSTKYPSTASDTDGTYSFPASYAFSQQPWYDGSGKTTLATITYGVTVQRLMNIVGFCES